MLFFFFFSLLSACNGTRMKHGHFLLCYHQDRGWQARQLLYWRARALKAAQAAQWTASACVDVTSEVLQSLFTSGRLAYAKCVSQQSSIYRVVQFDVAFAWLLACL